ncbi:MAG TPA: MEDS domain-containing protein [Myxococcales bacterium]|nr:MEDS domain-containing protein [Myxococcales bacterium]
MATQPDPAKQVRLAGALFNRPKHICAFFNSRDEEYRVMLPFIKEGFDEGQRAFHVIDSRRREEHLRALAEAGIDVERAKLDGQLRVRRWDDAYLKDGFFDPDRMLNLVEGAVKEGNERGYKATRFIANMEWALEGKPGIEELVVYETRFNYVLPKYDNIIVCCTYDVSRFGACLVMDMLRTHPMVIIGGSLQENPFWVPPDEFLAELRQRTETMRVN